MTMKEKLIRDLEEMKDCLQDIFNDVVPILVDKLEEFANELDERYKAVKVSKVAGNSAYEVGGVLAVIGSGLSFATFGASLGLSIAGGVIAGFGGITAGGASIAEYVNAKEAKRKAEEELEIFNKKFLEFLKKRSEISDILVENWDIEKAFPTWVTFWRHVVLDIGKVSYGLGYKIVASTVLKAIRIARGMDVTSDAASAAIPLVKTFGTAAKGFHIAGGVVGAIFLPIDVYCLVSNAVEIQKNTLHKDAERIRHIIKEIEKKRITQERIDEMIDSCVAKIHFEMTERIPHVNEETLIFQES